MVATVAQIIGKINPKLYASNGSELLKKYGSSDDIPAEEVKPQAIKYVMKDDIFKMKSSGNMEAKHTLIYDSSTETLEPLYFFTLDLISDMGFEIKKYVDNFSASPGSGHFSELGQRATIMQQQGAKILGDVNTVMRSVLNVVYDLREFNIRLQEYRNIKSENKSKSEAARLVLKQIWMDKVDILKGNSSIKAMALGQAGYQTLIDAFLVSKNESDVKKLDLNDRIKRILLPRIQEFNVWLKESEKELQKRYELERSYLKSQVNSLKLYTRWVKPYLKAAQQLESADKYSSPELIKVFNTILLELSLLAKSKLKVEDVVTTGGLPKDILKLKFKRGYNVCVLVDFKFRGIPQRVSQQAHFAFGGRAEVTFRAYSLNDDELKKLDEEMGKSDISDAFKLIEGATTESLDTLEDDINFFLEEEKDKEDKVGRKMDTSNPFLALVGYYGKKNKKNKKKSKTKKDNSDKGPVKMVKEDFVEKNYLRTAAADDAKEKCFNIFNTYKKAHDMPTYI